MAYIGSIPTTQSFISGTDYFNGTGSQTAFTLTRTVNSVNDIQVVVNNVVQQPNDAYTLSGTTLTFTSAPSSGTNNVYVRYLSTTTQSIAPSQNSVGWNQLDTNTQQDLGISFKNRIINGDMRIDQRNAGASVSANGFVVDRWAVSGTQSSKWTAQRNAGSVTPPAGFTNYLGITSSSAYSVTSTDYFQAYQPIEGLNVADLGWGTANAQTITLSFWVRSSLTGTFGGVLVNGAFNYSYPFTYTISSANTWEQKTITIAGPTSGTWATNNGVGVYVMFSFGSGSSVSGTAGAWTSSGLRSATGAVSVVGTNGATFYITGVQLEKGTQATAFDNRAYGTELALCQRYYWRITGLAVSAGYAAIGSGNVYSTTTSGRIYVAYPQTMRGAPTVSSTTLGYSAGTINAVNASIASSNPGLNGALVDLTLGTACTVGHGITVYLQNTTASYIDASSEL